MTSQTMGICKNHGQFVLKDGCPECIADRLAASEPTPQIVKVRYYSMTTGQASDREYSYYTVDPLEIGNFVQVPVNDRVQLAIVSDVNVPESEIESFKDRMKTIPSGSIRPDPEVAAVEEGAPRFETDLPTEDEIQQAEDEALVEEEHELTRARQEEADPNAWRTGEEEVRIESPALTAIELRPGEDLTVRGYHQEATRMLQYAEARVIKTIADAKLATDDLSLIRKVKKAMDDKRREYIAPADKALKEIRETYTFLMVPILQAEKITKEKQTTFLKEQAEIKRKQEEINLKRMQAAEEEMKLTQELSQPVDLIPEIVVPERIRTDLGTSGLTDHWVYEVVDMALLPDSYKLINNGLLNDHARKHQDTQPIPGVRFYNDPYLATRARKSQEE